MKSQFIISDLRTTDDVDWAGCLKGYLSKLYGNTNDFTREVNIINKLRLDVTNSIVESSNYEVTKNLYYKYYGQLELLDLRLPFQENGVKIKFRWYDAWEPKKHHSQYSLAYEKASILFNLGAVLSKIAESKFVEGEYAKSYQYFQYAAGIYRFISENFLHSPSIDLNVKTVQFLANLQLAQAQEVFLLKLLSEDTSKMSLIAKLAVSTSQQNDKTETSLGKIDEYYGEADPWTQILKFKTRFYLNLGYYYYGLSFEDKKVGLSIASLQMASDGFKELKKYENPTTIDYLSYVTLVEEKVKVLIKDNDFIFHDTIPSKSSLEFDALIKPLDAAKPIALQNQGNLGEIIGEDIFEKIIPTGVHEKLSLYSEEKAKILRDQLDNVEMVNIELESFLEYLRLPQSLSDFKNTNNNKLDPRLIDWSNYILNSPLSDVDKNRSMIQSKRDEILKLIKALDAELTQEEEDFNKKRYELNSLQEPSMRQSANLKDELTNAKQSLLSAGKLDRQINATIEPELKRLNNLKSKKALELDFFSEGGSANENLLDFYDEENCSTSTVNKSIAKIEDDLRILRDLKKERERILEELKIAIHEDDISNILVLNNKNATEKDEKALFRQELTKFDSLIKKIDIINAKQPDVIKNVKIHYDKIITSNNKISEKAQKLASYETTFNTFKEYQINYTKSVEFYNNLLNFVFEVKTNVDKFVSDRYLQRQRILNQLKPTDSSTSVNQYQQRSRESADLLEERFNSLSLSSQNPRGSLDETQRQPSFSAQSGYPQQHQWTQQSVPYDVPKPQPHNQPSYPSPQQYQTQYSLPLSSHQYQNQGQPLQQQQYVQQSYSPQSYQSPQPSNQHQEQQQQLTPQQFQGAPALPPKQESVSSYSVQFSRPNQGYSQPYDPNNFK